MRVSRNPFYTRTAEHIHTDATFLKLFSPGVLDVIPPGEPWQKLTILRSSAGGGKTSLLRLFTPSSLMTLYAYRNSDEHFKRLYVRLKELGALSDAGPCLAGAMLSCTHGYSSIEDLDVDDARKDRLLLALLNVRIVLSVLRSILLIKGCRYPDDLEHLRLEADTSIPLPPGTPYAGTGLDYFNWAVGVEDNICEAVDNIVPSTTDRLAGHDTLFSLWMVRAGSITWQGSPVVERVVVLLDDVEKLSSRQRHRLLTLLQDLRAPTQVWIAERLEALRASELLLSQGAQNGRDHSTLLEDYWRSNGKRFEAFARDVADKRANAAPDSNIESFSGCLRDTLEDARWHNCLSEALSIVSDRVKQRVASTPRYALWLARMESTDEPLRDQLIAWKTFEILITRDFQRSQKMLAFAENEELSEEQLLSLDQSDIRSAAEIMLCHEFDIPYYYGFGRLCALASRNIEQFLDFAGDLFEQAISASLLSRQNGTPEIKPEVQEKILKKAIDQRWQDIRHRVSDPDDVISLLQATGQFCRQETTRDSAPYAPGVTGIAMRVQERNRLCDPAHLETHPEEARLARVVASCLAHNYFEPVVDQRCKGETWSIFYLNRMLCLRFGLPLQYGGWRSKPPRELIRWIDRKGYTPKNQGTLL